MYLKVVDELDCLGLLTNTDGTELSLKYFNMVNF